MKRFILLMILLSATVSAANIDYSCPNCKAKPVTSFCCNDGVTSGSIPLTSDGKDLKAAAVELYNHLYSKCKPDEIAVPSWTQSSESSQLCPNSKVECYLGKSAAGKKRMVCICADHASLGFIGDFKCSTNTNLKGNWLIDDTDAPLTSISLVSSSTTSVSFAFSCVDDNSCKSTFYKVVDRSVDCNSQQSFTMFTPGSPASLSCQSLASCNKKICYYSVDDAGNKESMKASAPFGVSYITPCGDPTGQSLVCQSKSPLLCALKESCSTNEQDVLKLSSLTASQNVALPSAQVNYQYKLCCSFADASATIATSGLQSQYLGSLSAASGAIFSYSTKYTTQLYFNEDVNCALSSEQAPATADFKGRVIGSQSSLPNPYVIDNHQYLCYFNGSIAMAECCGGNSTKPSHCNSTVQQGNSKIVMGGVRKVTGQSISHSSENSKKTFYCTSDYRWVQDLDTIGKYTCQQAGFRWTGNYCCGEPDDLFEFYDDPLGYGICYNKTFIQNNTLIVGKNIYVSNGTAQGCNISSDIYNSTNNWLLTLRDYPNSGANSNNNPSKPLLVHDNSYCAQMGKPSQRYFCSYKELWVPGVNRTVLSTISWSSPENTQRSECCDVLDCWNGTSCVKSYHKDASKLPVLKDAKQWRCLFGKWTSGGMKYNWDREFSGYCQFDSQCLVDPLGNYYNNNLPKMYSPDNRGSNPQCINNTQYIMDHYCENGNWTTRTKYVVQKLLGNAGSDFTLFCDNYQLSLNYYEYLPSTFTYRGNADCTDLGLDEGQLYNVYFGSERRCPTNCTSGGLETNCANNVCVLLKGDQVILGLSLNQHANSSFYPFIDLLNLSKCDPRGVLTDGYRKCDSLGKVWYNSKLQTIIFSKSQIDISPSFWSQLKNWVQSLVANFRVRDDEEYNFVTANPQLNRLYMDNHGDKHVAAFMEEDVFDYGAPQSYLVARYSGFGANICDAFNASFNMKNPDNEYSCIKVNDAYEVRAQTNSPVFGIWKDFTARLRVR